MIVIKFGASSKEAFTNVLTDRPKPLLKLLEFPVRLGIACSRSKLYWAESLAAIGAKIVFLTVKCITCGQMYVCFNDSDFTFSKGIHLYKELGFIWMHPPCNEGRSKQEPMRNRKIFKVYKALTERPLGAHVSGTAPKSKRILIASFAGEFESLGLASSEQHPRSKAFSTCR